MIGRRMFDVSTMQHGFRFSSSTQKMKIGFHVSCFPCLLVSCCFNHDCYWRWQKTMKWTSFLSIYFRVKCDIGSMPPVDSFVLFERKQQIVQVRTHSKKALQYRMNQADINDAQRHSSLQDSSRSIETAGCATNALDPILTRRCSRLV